MKATATTTAMEYTTSVINKNFKIKVYGVDNNGKKINKLVGVSGLIALIGVEFVNKFVNRAFNEGADATYCKLRRGLKVTFYAH
jgi:hypothetical protein